MKRLALGIATAALLWLGRDFPLGNPAFSAEAPSEVNPVVTQNTFAEIAEKTLPSVVSVYVKTDIREQLKEMRERLGPLGDKFFQDPSLRPFFKHSPDGKDGKEGDEDNDDRGQSDGDPHKDMYETKTSGSGVVISEDGYIVTNLHIIDDAKPGTISVVLNDDTEIPAEKVKVVATDELIDLAVLKIDADKHPLKPLAWGDSDSMRIGDWVVAIGNPLDLRGSVSQGIISAKARKIEKVPIEHLIQTDAMINPGNSGGALVNLKGELIGINMAIATNSGFFQGIGFAIPSKDARFVTDQVIQNGKVRRGFIGIEMSPLNDKLRKALGIGDGIKEGIAVTDVRSGAPAEQAGVQNYDIITEVDGVKIKQTGDLLGIIAGKKVGETAKLTVLRSVEGNVKELSLLMKVAERPSGDELAKQRREAMTPTEKKKKEEPKGEIGLQLRPYSQGGVEGLEVVKIEPNSAASKSDPKINVGDVVIEVDRKTVKTLEDYNKAIEQAPKDRPHVVRYMQDGRRMLTTIERGGEK